MTFEAGGFNAFSDKGISTYGGMQKDGSIVYIGSVADKLAEYEDLEEQNKLLKLPCKAGQKVFLLRKDIKTVIDGEITSIRIGEFASDMKIFIIDDNRYTDASFDKIGDIVFFTKEEAEAALEELERGKGE